MDVHKLGIELVIPSLSSQMDDPSHKGRQTSHYIDIYIHMSLVNSLNYSETNLQDPPKKFPVSELAVQLIRFNPLTFIGPKEILKIPNGMV